MITQEVAYMVGATITGNDGPCGTIGRVVVDPITEVVTHVVANSPHQHGSPRLVPITLLGPYCESADGLQFHGTVADFYRQAIAKETPFTSPPLGFPGGVELDLTMQRVQDPAPVVDQPAV